MQQRRKKPSVQKPRRTQLTTNWADTRTQLHAILRPTAPTTPPPESPRHQDSGKKQQKTTNFRVFWCFRAKQFPTRNPLRPTLLDDCLTEKCADHPAATRNESCDQRPLCVFNRARVHEIILDPAIRSRGRRDRRPQKSESNRHAESPRRLVALPRIAHDAASLFLRGEAIRINPPESRRRKITTLHQRDRGSDRHG